MEKSIFSTEGRIRRSTYFIRIIISTVIAFLSRFVLSEEPSTVGLFLIVIFLVIIFQLIQGVKRIHDLDKSGWYTLIPVYNIILHFTEGQPRKNKYGEDPKAEKVIENDPSKKNDASKEFSDIINTILLIGFIAGIIYALLSATKII